MRWSDASAALHRHADKQKAVFLQRFFKTGPGEYAQGDVFLGVTAPATRLVAKSFKDLPLTQIAKGLSSRFHEERLLALFILVHQFQKAEESERQVIFDFYLANTAAVNNWDLVDSSASQIVGMHLLTRKRAVLYRLVRSKNLWERRIAMVATHAFIRAEDYADCLKLAEALLGDKHDLMHKASGWMLREVGKRDKATLLGFLDKHHPRMPRVMLRYAIEHLPLARRRAYLKAERAPASRF